MRVDLSRIPNKQSTLQVCALWSTLAACPIKCLANCRSCLIVVGVLSPDKSTNAAPVLGLTWSRWLTAVCCNRSTSGHRSDHRKEIALLPFSLKRSDKHSTASTGSARLKMSQVLDIVMRGAFGRCAKIANRQPLLTTPLDSS